MHRPAALRHVLAVAWVGIMLFGARRAAAAPTSRLVYVRTSGAESCPDEAELRTAVAGRLGYDPFRPFAPSTLTVEVRRVGRSFKGSVRLVDGDGVERGARDLASASDACADLTTALALSMSIAIDPLSALGPPPAPAAPDATPPVEKESEPPPPPPPPSASKEKEAPSPPKREPPFDRAGWLVGLGVHGAVGSAPGPAFGMRAGVELANRRLSLGAEGRLDLPAGDDTPEGGRVLASMAGGALVPCVRFGPGAACGVLFLARAAVESRDITVRRDDAFFFLAGGARLAGDIDLVADLRLRAFVEGLGHATPYELAVNGRTVYRLPAVSGTAGLSILRIF